jgi:probable F420-dependent oxidoreductase
VKNVIGVAWLALEATFGINDTHLMRGGPLQVGLTLFPTDYSILPAELAVAAEERGFESLWFPDHTHIPLARRSPWPGGPELPKMYYDLMEPFISLATAASVTRRLRLGTGVCLLVQRDPLQTAKDVASLDRLSQGRFLFGVGAGWNAEEMADHGTRFETRGRLLRERIEALKVIWTQKKPEYHGEFVDFAPMMSWPKPVQTPHPPIHVGGGWPQGARRAVRWGDGWMPIHGRDAIDPARFRALAEQAGRDPASLELSVYAPPPDEAVLARLREAGVDRVVFGLPPAPRDEILPLLDARAKLMERLR